MLLPTVVAPRVSYVAARRSVHFLAACLAVLAAAFAAPALAAPVQIVCLGDSLSAGYLLPADAAFPAVLEKALRARGLEVRVANAGVSGDTTSGGLARLDWSVTQGAEIVILELGANDMLRGLAPKIVRDNLEAMLARLQARGIKVLLAGMLASPDLGRAYKTEFEAIYPELSRKFGVPLDPFFLEGVTGVPGMNLPGDSLHPNRAGVEAMVARVLPLAEAMVREIRR